MNRPSKLTQVSGLAPGCSIQHLTFYILNLTFFVCLFAGCTRPQADTPPPPVPTPVSAPTPTPAPAPAVEIAGLWESSGQNPWKITLAPDGTVSDIVRADGLHFVLSEGMLEMEPAEDVYARYVFGPCTWTYDAASRRLEVVLIIDDMYVKTSETELHCSVIDEFSGDLSEDGQTWAPRWISTAKFDPPMEDQVSEYGQQTFTKTQ
jgi:hypothetical protein